MDGEGGIPGILPLFLAIALEALNSRCSSTDLPSCRGGEKTCVIGVELTNGRLGPGMRGWDMVDDTPCELAVWRGTWSRLWLPPWLALVPVHIHLPVLC